LSTFADAPDTRHITIPATTYEIDSLAFSGCSSLTSIHYTGSKEQWQSILFGTDWDLDTADYTVYCTDGTLVKGELVAD
jgi:hypothetical protein